MKYLKLSVMVVGVFAFFAGCNIFTETDLDETYFPFGLGYEWCYERHDSGRREPEYPEDTNTTWSRYDTFSVKVIDSLWEDDTLILECEVTTGYFDDVRNPVKIWNNRIEAFFNWGFMKDTIRLVPKEKSKSDNDNNHGFDINQEFNVSYNGDTLILEVVYSYNKETNSVSTFRLIGIGVIRQSLLFRYGEIGSHSLSDRLLYFYNGQDTIYKAE